MNARVGNSKITNTVGTYVEVTLHNSGKKTDGFWQFNN
jgi:hypothetical protein